MAVALGSLALAGPAGAHETPFSWSVAKVMGAVDEERIRVGKSAVRIEADTTLCAGEGRSKRSGGGVRRWKHFLCTYTTITPRGIGRDVDFRVHVLGVRRFVVTEAHWVPDSP